jgi:hypothetical protein
MADNIPFTPGSPVRIAGTPVSLVWSALPTPSASLAGMQVFCTDYPTSEGTGVLLTCTGTRWKPLGNEHPIISQSWAAGLTIAAASAEAIIGDVVKTLPAGMLKEADSLVLQCLYENVADAAGASTTIRIRSHTTNAVLSGQESLKFIKSSTTFTQGDLDRMSRVLSNTVGRQAGAVVAGAIVATGANLAVAFADLSALSYMGLTIQNASDTETATLYFAQLLVRYG